MPYRTRGKTVQVKKRGKWRKKASAKSTAAAKRMVRLLNMVKAGVKLRKRKKK